MNTIATVLEAAATRAAELQLPYQGALTPAEAQQVAEQLPQAVLVDVRSAAEWQFVGMIPDTLRIEWKTWPGMQPNPQFLTQLEQQVAKDAVLLLICRTGVRSDEAARLATSAGYNHVYNVLEGFEGDKNADGHRGSTTGWKARGLPWMQG